MLEFGDVLMEADGLSLVGGQLLREIGDGTGTELGRQALGKESFGFEGVGDALLEDVQLGRQLEEIFGTVGFDELGIKEIGLNGALTSEKEPSPPGGSPILVEFVGISCNRGVTVVLCLAEGGDVMLECRELGVKSLSMFFGCDKVVMELSEGFEACCFFLNRGSLLLELSQGVRQRGGLLSREVFHRDGM